jgi:competence protein ComEA
MAVKPMGKVNINTADEATLMALKGIGESKAKAILEYRQTNGPFKSVEDLTKVKGIGDTTLSQIRDLLTVE